MTPPPRTHAGFIVQSSRWCHKRQRSQKRSKIELKVQRTRIIGYNGSIYHKTKPNYSLMHSAILWTTIKQMDGGVCVSPQTFNESDANSALPHSSRSPLRTLSTSLTSVVFFDRLTSMDSSDQFFFESLTTLVYIQR